MVPLGEIELVILCTGWETVWSGIVIGYRLTIYTVHLEQKRPNWRITYLLYYLFDWEYIHIYKFAIICSIAHKILVAMVTTFENTSLATAELAYHDKTFNNKVV